LWAPACTSSAALYCQCSTELTPATHPCATGAATVQGLADSAKGQSTFDCQPDGACKLKITGLPISIIDAACQAGECLVPTSAALNVTAGEPCWRAALAPLPSRPQSRSLKAEPPATRFTDQVAASCVCSARDYRLGPQPSGRGHSHDCPHVSADFFRSLYAPQPAAVAGRAWLLPLLRGMCAGSGRKPNPFKSPARLCICHPVCLQYKLGEGELQKLTELRKKLSSASTSSSARVGIVE
jgi:hypothetical protein